MTAAAALKEAVTGKAPEQPGQRELTGYERLKNYLQAQSFINEIAILVGGEAQARTFVRVVLTAVQQTPRLIEADRRTLLLACMKAARDRLMPDGKEAVLNIYNTKVKDDKTGRDTWVESVQYLPMAAGLIKKMYQSGEVSFVDSAAVYANDEFIFERGDNPKLVHRPTMADDAGIIIAAYVVVKLTNGEIKREVMPRRDIEKVRAASKAPDGPGWKNWYDQFAIKSVIKRSYKQLPSSVELEQVIASDNEAMGFRDTAAAAGLDAFATEAAPAATPEEQKPAQPAIEHNPGETIPPIVGESTRVAETVTAGSETKPGEGETTSGKPAANEGKKQEADAAPVYADVAGKIVAAKTIDELNVAADLIRSVQNKAHARELNLEAANKRIELTKDDGK